MTTLDWVIVAFVLLMALWGYLQGLVVSAFSLTGFAVGALVGARVAPLFLSGGSSSPYAPLFTLIGGLMLGSLAAVLLESVGENLRRRMRFPRAAELDGIGGALLVGALGMALVWIAGAVALQTPGASRFRKDIQRSTILADLNAVFPPSGPILNALARFDPVPRIAGPVPDVARPTRRILRDPDVRDARPGVVKVLGTACGLGVQGSGWIAAPGLVVTNAHVVAGQDDTTVEGSDGTPHGAQAMFFDSRNDVAVLRVGDPRRPRPAAPRRGSLRRAGGDPRVPEGRPFHCGRRPAGADSDRHQRRRLRARAGVAPHDLAARADPLRELRRTRDRQGRARGGDGLRGDHERPAGRLRGSGVDRHGCGAEGAEAGGYRAVCSIGGGRR